MKMDLKEKSSQNDSLTEGQKLRIKKGKERALMIRQSRLTAHPYNNGDVVSIDKTIIKIGSTNYKDTGGGFLLEENSEKLEELVIIITTFIFQLYNTFLDNSSRRTSSDYRAR
ncbi:hypothetical protein AMK59_6261 [Oryctes borbonicus]|uniref:Uncharacterized protein n=1 Tax=Oryctes borbonicus TaxID=1629725 RepID=A0A0T6B3L0_9SCAR|nr:hypothetical protein AMK59_6261 [Oryctes borbonicus]